MNHRILDAAKANRWVLPIVILASLSVVTFVTVDPYNSLGSTIYTSNAPPQLK